MTEAIVAGAVAGAIAGAIVALAVGFFTRTRAGRWRSFVSSERASAPQMATTHPHAPQRYSALDFQLFDESAKRVLAVAQDEALRMNHNYIGTEHLLLGLIRGDSGGPAGRALARLGVSLDKARTALDFIIGRGETPTTPQEITMSPRAKRVLELAQDEARTLGRAHIGAEEILLGLLREGQGIASGIIESLGATLDAMRQAVLEEMAGVPPRPASGPQGVIQRQTHTYRGPFDRFNDRAKRTLALAQDEAVRLNHSYIGPEHLLLGLVREGEGVAGRVLNRLGIELSKTRQAVEQVIGRGDSASSPTESTLTPRAKKVIELAIDESRKLGHNDVGTEHLLLGLVRDDTSVACQILRDQGAPLEKIRHHVIATLGGQAPLSDDQPPSPQA